MANNRPKAPQFRTPKGIFRFPKLSEVDYGTKEFPKAGGEYSNTLILKASDPKVQAFIKKLEPLYEQAMHNAETQFKALKAESRKKLVSVKPNPLFTELLDPDTEEPTGDIAFKFSMKASGEYKKGPKEGKYWDSRPAIFNKAAELVVPGFRFRDRLDDETADMLHGKVRPDIWGGTTGYVSFEVALDKDGNPGYFIPGTAAAGLKLGLLAIQVIDVVSGGQRSASDYGFGNEAEDDAEEADSPASSGTDGDDADF